MARLNKWWWAVVIVLTAADAVCAAGPRPPRNPVAGFAFLLSLGAGITAFMVWGRATFPQLARRSDEVVGANGAWRTFWVGLVNFIAALLVLIATAKLGKAIGALAVLVGLSVMVAAAVTAFRGAMGIWPAYGHRILDGDASDLQSTMAGGAMLTGISLLFPVGLVFLLYVMIRSLGAGMLLMVKGGEAQPSAT